MAVTRRGIITFAVGLLFGFAITYMFTISTSISTRLKFSPRQKVSYTGGLIPDSPHSHGEMDNVKGPDQSVNWADEHSHRHTEQSSAIAHELAVKIRVLCWVMTNPSNIQTKAMHVKATWGKRCNVLLFMSSEVDATLPAIKLPVSEGRNNLWAKTKEAFKYVYTNHFNDADWFLKADDDTYVILENLRHFLSDKDTQKPLYYGRRFKPYVSQGYMSGGAGYVLSKDALKRFVDKAVNDPGKCRNDNGGAEDLEMGRCLEKVGVLAEDTRDELGRERFHPFVPEHHLIPGILPADMWYWSYSYYPAKQGPDCCSDYAITFHYVSPNMMYIMEYMIYHLKPFGISVVEQCPDNKEQAQLTKVDAEPPLQHTKQLAPSGQHQHIDVKVDKRMESKSISHMDKNVIVDSKNTVHQKDSAS